MHSRFDHFKATALGLQLQALINTPERYLEYAALSRAEVPAVAAIIHDLRAKFPEVEGDQTARQFCGAMVADVMRRHHHEILRPRGRVLGDYFTYGAVWSPLPSRKTLDELLSALGSMPDELARMVDALPVELKTIRPLGTGFSVVEHVCHLRDLDTEAYRDRIERVLISEAPLLASVDGSAQAAERDYQNQKLSSALSSFRNARLSLVTRLSKIKPEDRCRYGLFDGIHRMTIDDLVVSIHEHDRTHLQELDELAVEITSLIEMT